MHSISYRITCSCLLLACCSSTWAQTDTNCTTDAHDLTICRHPNQGPVAITTILADARLAGATTLLSTVDNLPDIACCVVLRRLGGIGTFPAAIQGPQFNNITNDTDLGTVLNDGCSNVKVVNSAFGVCGAAGVIAGCANRPGTDMVLVGQFSVQNLGGFEDGVWAHEFGHNQNLVHVADVNRVMNPTIFPSSRSIIQTECDAYHGAAPAGHSPPDTVLGGCGAPVAEACCMPNGTCIDVTPANCTASGGTPQGCRTTCATVMCTPPTEACCMPNGTCTDVLPATCTGAGGTPQGPGTTCATAQCIVTEACCFDNPPGTCADVPAMDCQLGGGDPQGPGTNCATTQCKIVFPKFQQPPTAGREDIPSNINFMTMTTDVVVADDFQSDGRPITCVRWWGSYFDPQFQPLAFGGLPSPFEIDGWLISFHEPLTAGGPNPPEPPLGLYFCELPDVDISTTSIPACDGHEVYEYNAELLDCCILHSNPDSRSGWFPTQFEGFEEEHCFVYDIDIQAVIGASWERDPGSGMCIPFASQNMTQGQNVWGWHSTDIENGFRPALQSTTTMGPMGEWLYEPWIDVQPSCSPSPVNMAFELMTTDPTTPPECTEACCLPDGSCGDAIINDCIIGGGSPQGPGTNCATTLCPLPPEACCLPDGTCTNVDPITCDDCNGVPGGFGSDCLSFQCPIPQDEACCLPDGTCQVLAPATCVNTSGIRMSAAGCGTIECPQADGFLFEFSVDIGSDNEISDPQLDGDEAFDPGDVYWWRSAAVISPGRDGFKDDKNIFGSDPNPKTPDAAGTTRVPVGTGGFADFADYFDLDAHDQIDASLSSLGLVPPAAPAPGPIAQFASLCIHEPNFIMVSFDDDMSPSWPTGDVPVMAPSAFAGMTYGMTGISDEVLGVTLGPFGAPPPLTIMSVYPVADEIGVHASLAPNPDFGEPDDDDVDSLDIVASDQTCPNWYFSADHEASNGLDSGAIYEVTAVGPVLVIDDMVHLGIPEDTDIDAFEFAWLEDPTAPGGLSLAILFSVDDDDPLTAEDESGGMDPTMIHVSFMTGFSFPMTDPLFDDVDALTVWTNSLAPCPGNCNGDPVIDINDFGTFIGCVTGPNAGPLPVGCVCADMDGDDDVDLSDFALYQQVFESFCP